jgi:DNA-binding GntR family transcriptional regulator
MTPIRRRPCLSVWNRGPGSEAARDYTLIVEAIRGRDAVEAQSRMVLHCESAARTLIARHLRLAAA